MLNKHIKSNSTNFKFLQLCNFSLSIYYLIILLITHLLVVTVSQAEVSSIIKSIKNSPLVNNTVTGERRQTPGRNTTSQNQNQNQDQHQTKKVNPPPILWKEYWHTSSNANLTRVYVNSIDLVAIYHDSPTLGDVLQKQSWLNLFAFVSQVWSYMTKTYGKFGPNPYLNFVVHNNENLTGTSNKFYRSFFAGNFFDYQNRVDVGSVDVESISWLQNKDESHDNNENDYDELDKIVRMLGHLVQYSRKDRYGLALLQIWGGQILNAWGDIFTYDLYIHLNRTVESENFKNKTINEGNAEHIFWFRDWFLPIYSMYGGNRVLQKYLKLLQVYVPQSSELNIGEFVHIWCGASETNLTDRVRFIVFPAWNQTHQDQFLKARQEYPDISKLYPGDTDVVTTEQQKDLIFESQPQSKTTITIISISLAILVLTIASTSMYFINKKRSQLNKGTYLTSDGLLSPLVKGFEIPRDKIILDRDKMIGAGHFGNVIKGFVLLTETGEPLPVALKYLKPGADKLQFDALIAEVNLMANVGRHENIFDLIGTYTGNIENHELYLALEFCLLGNLHDYLGNNRNHFEFRRQITADLRTVPVSLSAEEGNSISSLNVCGNEVASNRIISTTDLLGWALNISNAMVYLSSKKVIHRDLATRNVLLTKNRTAKISDFGLSKDLPLSDTYSMTSTIFLPWKWMAIESLTEHKFSTPSDVWSFGVTLWEIFSLSQEPYVGSTSNDDFIRRLSNGERLLRPPYASVEVYNLMTECWKTEPSERPSFSQVRSALEELINPCHSQLLGSNVPVQISGLYV